MKMLMPKTFADGFKNYNKFSDTDRCNTGKKTIILASSSPASEKVGFCIGEHAFGKHMANYIKNSTDIHKVLGIPSSGIHIQLKATADDLYNVLNDRTINNIILLGHANFETRVSMTGSVSNYDIGRNINDHVKKGVFVNAGCAKIFKDSFLPLGTFAVKDWNKIYGVPKGKLLTKDDIKKANFVQHEVQILDFMEYHDKKAYDKLIAKIDRQLTRELMKRTISPDINNVHI